MKTAVLLLLLACVGSVFSHSWIACSNYQGNTGNYDNSQCKGYARNFFNYVQNGNTFGLDNGYNYQATEAKPCIAPLASPVSAGYSTAYPPATYKAGQKVTLAWPSKNHVAASCTNQWIPDAELDIFVLGPNPPANPTLSAFKKTLVANLSGHVNGQMDFKGFQNCPNFCQNMDKALCTGTFTVPNLAPGQYTFMWYWIFNPGSDPYTSCWDVTVS
eukprot:TRINITY_DN1556_c0_g1_i4.p1 TRINITY_DN1556_c0_g1~~TRINITY_DN1556_c0_g1_i4.p1  ORF type:complete len:216 (+),score=36.00 TRINITY_DN1556_c0_g1_i4:158-805(+)